MRVPEGVNVENGCVALRLNKSIYGLKVSSHNWYVRFTEELIKLGFKRLMVDQCFFVFEDELDIIVIAFYVDDGIVVASNEKKGEILVEKLSKVFKMKFMLNPKMFLGVKIGKVSSGFKMNQELYI